MKFSMPDNKPYRAINFQHNHGQGFSIIEIMVALLIFAVITGAIFGAMAIARISWSTSSVKINLQQVAREALEFMVRELRAAESTPVISVGGSQIDFSVAGIGSIRYNLSSSKILRTNGDPGLSPDGRPIELANNISALQFTSQTNGVTINITAYKVTYLNQPVTFVIVGNASFRN